ncbi:hypothetical protein FACS189459_1310 [Bacilli bacterium]|nr:hypothetical protein FACS189459_1310 [Bacilli bacterium]
MYPMSLLESENFAPSITISDLFTNKEITDNKKGLLTIDQILNLTIRGG